MPEKRQNYELAYEDYKNGIKQREIAEKYGVSISAVKTWKARYWNEWDKEKRSQPTGEKVANNKQKGRTQKRTRGGQSENKNAVGHGAPEGNTNNLKHGIFQKLVYETLPADIKEVFHEKEIDPERELESTIMICNAEILRLFKLIKQAEEKHGGQFIHNIAKGESVGKDKSVQWQTTNTYTISANDLILRYRNEIQKYLKQKVRCLESLIKIDYDTNKLEIDLIKAQALIKLNNEPEDNSSNFIEALQAATPGAWASSSEKERPAPGAWSDE